MGLGPQRVGCAASFTAGEEEVECGPGNIVIAPAGTAHKFVNVGEEILRQVNIHPVPRMQTEWLE